MKKITLSLLIGFGLMIGSTSTLSAGCGGCPKLHFPHFGCKKTKHVKKSKKHCGFHLPKCFRLPSCKK